MADLAYTTTEAIARRLTGRLNITDNGFSQPFAKNFGELACNEELIKQIAEQKEAFVNSILRRIYVFPLQLVEKDTRAILAEITENLIVSDLINIYYQTTPGSQLNTDVSGLGTNSANRASQLLAMYCVGHNISIPGVPQQMPGMGAISLPGETLQIQRHDTLTRNEVQIGRRRRSAKLNEFDFGNNRSTQGNSLGYEHPDFY
jgi:hypothetical protein